MKAVIDSSALIFAYKSKKILGLIKNRFDGLLLPRTVYEEVVSAGKRLGKEEANSIEEEIKTGFLKIKEPSERIAAENMGKGELEAISLAHLEHVPVIIDDRKARILGVSLKLKVFPVSSFILWGVREGHLSSTEGKEILNELVKGGYWLKGDVYLSLVEAIEGITKSNNE